MATSLHPVRGLPATKDTAVGFSVDCDLSEEDAELFTHLLVTELPAFYDEVDSSFPEMIVRAARAGHDPCGYFTRAKQVFVGRQAGRPVVFTVASHKRGGAVKIGPTVVVPELRRGGTGTVFRHEVESRLHAGGARKLYLTITSTNTRTVLFNLGLGYQIEGVLNDQYRKGARELVLGKLIRPSKVRRIGRGPLAEGATADPSVHFGPVDEQELADYLLPQLADTFAGLDGGFVRDILSALEPARQRYASKGKELIVARRDGKIVGVVVFVPKRGGAVKLSPLVVDDRAALELLVSASRQRAEQTGRHRLYAVVPQCGNGIVEYLCRQGFSLEAQLREAYHPGVDSLVLGLLT